MSKNSYESSGGVALHLHLCFLLLILMSLVGVTWYINYDSFFEGIIDQIKLLLTLSPLFLLLVLHLMPRSPSLLPEQDSSGTPWGVGLMLVLLLFMLSYQSDLRDRWFPLLS
ncbi:Unknown protein [Striga hermonthica]|uniref:Transmembrane protein n=1 Tax=Striga hermonthica TaxID=68872 RepID=A0A9N7RGK0_STRHE|nr:Unknown protein [Striga hermonthica]